MIEMKMKTSTEIESIARLVGESKAIELIAKAGFDAWDLSLFKMATLDRATLTVKDSDHPLHTSAYASYIKELRKIGEEYGIVCNQSHAPFPSRGKEMMYYLKRSIECTALAGGEICIIHPDNHKSAEENAEMYFDLLPTAHEYGVKIATENMWNRDSETRKIIPAACSHHTDFLKHIQAVNDPYLVACLDVGHAEMGGLDTSIPEMVHTLGDHLQALHIHDNDLAEDLHEIPFSMKIDFEEMVQCLIDIGYKGYFTLESCEYIRNRNIPAENAYEAVKDLADSARKLADRFEELSK